LYPVFRIAGEAESARAPAGWGAILSAGGGVFRLNHATVELFAGKLDPATAAEADEADVRADPGDAPVGGAAGVGFAQADALADDPGA
jgi:hypothetical protein